MNLTHRDPFNFTVGNIEFVILREADPRWRMDRLTPKNHYSLALARSGSATYETDLGAFPVKSGDVLFFRKGEDRSAESSSDDPWSFISVVFDLIPLGKTSEDELALIPCVTSVRDLPTPNTVPHFWNKVFEECDALTWLINKSKTSKR